MGTINRGLILKEVQETRIIIEDVASIDAPPLVDIKETHVAKTRLPYHWRCGLYTRISYQEI